MSEIKRGYTKFMTHEYPQKHIIFAPLLWKIWGPIPTECQLFLMITVLEKSRHMNILHSNNFQKITASQKFQW